MARSRATTANDIQNWLRFLDYAHRTYTDLPQDLTVPSLADDDYVAPHIGSRVICATAITTALAVAVVAARLVTRYLRTSRGFGLDDLAIVVASVAQIGFFVVQVCAVRYGCVGYNVYDCSMSDWVVGFRYRYAGLLLYYTATMMTKISVCFYFLRLIPARVHRCRRVVQGTLIVLVLTFILSLLQSAFTCMPIKTSWDIWARVELDVKCSAEWQSVLAWAIIYSLLDVWLVGLSIWLVLRLSLLKKGRFGILLVLCFGLAASACSFVKWPNVRKAYYSYNATWNSVPLLINAQLESALGLIAVSLPAFSFLLARMLPSKPRGKVSRRSSAFSTPPPLKERRIIESITSSDESPTKESYRLPESVRAKRWPSLKRFKGEESREKNREGARSGQSQRHDMRSPSPFDGFNPPVIVTAAGPSDSPRIHPVDEDSGAITRTIRINQSFEPSGQPFEPLNFDPPSVFRFDPRTDMPPPTTSTSTRLSSHLRPMSVADDLSIDLVIQGPQFGTSESDSMGTIYEGSSN